MNVSLGRRWEEFVAEIVSQGRYKSSSEVVREGLRLVEEREANLVALRETVGASLAAGGNHTPENVAARLDVLMVQAKSDGLS